MQCGGYLVTKRIVRNLPSTAKHYFLYMFHPRERSRPLSEGPSPPIIAVIRFDCRSSRFRGRLDQAIIQLSFPSMIQLAVGLTTYRTAGHKKSRIVQTVSPLIPRFRQTTLPFDAASIHLALMPSEKTEGVASTFTKTTIPSIIVGILLFLRVAA